MVKSNTASNIYRHMRKYIRIFTLLSLSVIFLMSCSRKGRIITEPDFGIYNFTTYTIDSFRFRIILNGTTLTDSLWAPVGFFSRSVSFFETGGRLQVVDARNNNQLVLDTVITLKTGVNFYSLLQLFPGQKPFIPPLPTEPAPSAGNYKVRFQYTPFIGAAGFPAQPFFYDSVLCYVRRNGVEIDTVLLRKYDITPYYEAGINGGGTFSLILEDPATGNIIDAATSPTIGGAFIGFNTVSVSGRAAVDDWVLLRMY